VVNPNPDRPDVSAGPPAGRPALPVRKVPAARSASDVRPVDPRGPRFGAALTAVVVTIALLTASVWVLAAQTLVFALASVVGLQASPYSWLYRVLLKPRLGPPTELEDPRPPRFAQVIGLVVCLPGVVLGLLGVPFAVETSAALALVASFLNAAFGLCLGCELYLVIARLRAGRTATAS